MDKRLVFLLLLLVVVALGSCTTYERRVYISSEQGCVSIGDIEILADVTKGDERLSADPELSGNLLPLDLQ